jgi:DNA-binding LacI/PurR family transcriptional regulator
MSTLKSIAARCGVDISTVSRALRSDPRVKEETRQRVQKVAAELQYSPNLAARNLVKGRSKTLALITSSLTNPIEQMPAQYASLYLQEKSYDLMISLSGGSAETFERLLFRLEQNIFDGAIIIPGCPFTGEGVNILHRLEKRGFPLVFLDRWDTRFSFPVVTTCNFEAGSTLAGKLVTRGSGSILILKMYDNGVEEDRIAGMIEACNKMGIPHRIINMNDPIHSLEIGDTTGILASSSFLIHQFCRDYLNNIKKGDLLFGVFDQWAGSIYPAAEVIVCRQDFKSMAHRACKLILNKLVSNSREQQRFSVEPLGYDTLNY